MSKGYAEGPAAEEAERRRDELASAAPADARPERLAVYGSTWARADRHFLGWRDDVDPDALFESGEAGESTVMRGGATAR